MAKLNASGSALVYSTYLGGRSLDEGNGIAVDPAGNVYLAGTTGSFNFPTVSPFQSARQADLDGFAAKLNAAGSALVYSTFLGGSRINRANGIGLLRQCLCDGHYCVY